MSFAHARLNLALWGLYLAGGFLALLPDVKFQLLRYGVLGEGRLFQGYFPNLIPHLPIHWGIASLTLAGALYALLLPARRVWAIVPWLVLYTLLALADVRVLPAGAGLAVTAVFLAALGAFGALDELRPRARFPLVFPRRAWPLWLAALAGAVFTREPMLAAALVAFVNPAWIPARGRAGDLILFFDGHCGLCNRSVDFLIREDAGGRLRYSPLQGPTADEWRRRDQLPTMSPAGDFDTMLVAHGDRVHERSAAVLLIGEHLGGLWRVFAWLARGVPRPARDFVYGQIARHRYRLFGRRETCRLPSKEERRLFV